MQLDFIPLDRLCVGKANMRFGKKPPDVSDILPTVRARGVLTPLIVRACAGAEGAMPAFEILAGSRRFHAARIVAEERRADPDGAGGEPDPEGDKLPCAIIESGDDAAAIEASLIENLARLDPDEVAQWETFARLVKEGRTPEAIAATFGLPELAVRRVLALGNLNPRIRKLYRDERIDRATVRPLTLATAKQQAAWLALFDDPDAYVPTGHQLKAWLFGGQTVTVEHALFDVQASGLATVADLFGEERYLADAEAFWQLQNAALAERRQGYLDVGWADAVIVPPGEYFQVWDHAKASKRKRGRVYLDVRESGEVIVHEGYLTRTEARRLESGEPLAPENKPARPEVSGPLQGYIDLHRHAAVRAALTDRPELTLRLMIAHAICGSPLWSVRVEPQTARSDAVRESVETSPAEAAFDGKRRAVLALLGFGSEEPSVTGGNGDPYGLVGVFLRLIELPDADVLAVIAVVMGETLAAGSAAVEAVGEAIGLDMSQWWQADEAFFGLVRDREVLTALVAEVAGPKVAEANAKAKGATLKTIIRDCLAGSGGRPEVEAWVPQWMAFPPSAYTARGGVGALAAHALVEAAKAERQAEPAAAAACEGEGADDDTPPWREGAEAETEDETEAPDGAEVEAPAQPERGEADPDATVERIAA